MKIKVSNMYSSAGNPVANQFIITGIRLKLPVSIKGKGPRIIEGTMFQSYGSCIAFVPYDNSTGGYLVYLDENDWDYSVTTGKYRNNFLNEGIAETRENIAKGRYKLVDLN